jgi:hypothetical protein
MFVVSLPPNRRHLSESPRAMGEAKMANRYGDRFWALYVDGHVYRCLNHLVDNRLIGKESIEERRGASQRALPIRINGAQK